MEGGSKKSDLFTAVHWPLIHIFLINTYIIYDTASSTELVLLWEGWDAFTSDHPSMQVFHPKFEIRTKTIGASARTSTDYPHHSSTLPRCRYSLYYVEYQQRERVDDWRGSSAEVSADAPIVLVRISNLGWKTFIEGWSLVNASHPSQSNTSSVEDALS